MIEIKDDDSLLESVETGYNSGGNIYLDFITLKDGTVLVVSEDAIGLYRNRESFDEGVKPIYFKQRPTLYQVISPDGFAFHPTDVFLSEKEAIKHFEKVYKKRFEAQGYYSTADRKRIPLEDLENYCSVKPI